MDELHQDALVLEHVTLGLHVQTVVPATGRNQNRHRQEILNCGSFPFPVSEFDSGEQKNIFVLVFKIHHWQTITHYSVSLSGERPRDLVFPDNLKTE